MRQSTSRLKVGLVYKGWEIIEIYPPVSGSNRRIKVQKDFITKDLWNTNEIFRVNKDISASNKGTKISHALPQIVKFEEKIDNSSPLHIYKELYERFYNKVYELKKEKKKALKDIVGAQYNEMRAKFWESQGFEVKKEFIHCGVKCDLGIFWNGKLVVVEEDKGSYLDKTFLARAISDAADIFYDAIEKKLSDVPNFLVSSPTTYTNYQEVLEIKFKPFQSAVSKLMNEKFLYMPLSNSNRVPQEKYFKTETPHLTLTKSNLEMEMALINKIKKESTK